MDRVITVFCVYECHCFLYTELPLCHNVRRYSKLKTIGRSSTDGKARHYPHKVSISGTDDDSYITEHYQNFGTSVSSSKMSFAAIQYLTNIIVNVLLFTCAANVSVLYQSAHPKIYTLSVVQKNVTIIVLWRCYPCMNFFRPRTRLLWRCIRPSGYNDDVLANNTRGLQFIWPISYQPRGITPSGDLETNLPLTCCL